LDVTRTFEHPAHRGTAGCLDCYRPPALLIELPLPGLVLCPVAFTRIGSAVGYDAVLQLLDRFVDTVTDTHTCRRTPPRCPLRFRTLHPCPYLDSRLIDWRYPLRLQPTLRWITLDCWLYHPDCLPCLYVGHLWVWFGLRIAAALPGRWTPATPTLHRYMPHCRYAYTLPARHLLLVYTPFGYDYPNYPLDLLLLVPPSLLRLPRTRLLTLER